MPEPFIRMIFRDPSSKVLSDGDQDCELAEFGGFLPAIGDMILDPGVLQGLDRRVPANRRVLTVVGRVFNPRDIENCVALIVEERRPSKEEETLLPA